MQEKKKPPLTSPVKPVGAPKREQVGHVQPTDALPTRQLSTLKEITAIVGCAPWRVREDRETQLK